MKVEDISFGLVIGSKKRKVRKYFIIYFMFVIVENKGKCVDFLN